MEAARSYALIVQNPYQMGYVGTQLMKALIEKDGATIKFAVPLHDPATGKFGDENGDIYTTELRVGRSKRAVATEAGDVRGRHEVLLLQGLQGLAGRAQADRLLVHCPCFSGG